jgi:CHASE3 domain sensor protein
MTFKNKVTAGFGTAVIVLILVGASAYWSVLKNDEDRLWVTHTRGATFYLTVGTAKASRTVPLIT